MDFACELMDLCRGTQEVQAILGGEHIESSRDPLARLRLAIHYGEKKAIIDTFSTAVLCQLCCNNGKGRSWRFCITHYYMYYMY